MQSIRNLVLSLLVFVLGWSIGSGWGVVDFPKQEVARVLESLTEEAGGWWKFRHRRQPMTSDFKTIVTTAVDFLYSSAALDAHLGPHVFQVPAMERYWTLQFMEEDTDVYGYIGSRIHGKDKPVNVLIVPPGYRGETHGLEVIEMVDRKCWVIARIHIYNQEDKANVHALQDKMLFIPLASYLE